MGIRFGTSSDIAKVHMLLGNPFVLLGLCAMCGLGLCALCGCGDGRPTRVPVSGQVLIDGKPLTRGEVRFLSEVGRSSIGLLDRKGQFTLSCYEENDGALLGKHKVTITAAEGLGPNQTRWFAPKKFSDPGTSRLTQEILGPVDNLVLNISWEGGHEFVETEQGAASAADEGMHGKRGTKKKLATE
jgi:hypothetical protein